ncbi:MAG: DUF6807 family protein [Chitinophagaceae bacterium]
MQGQGFTTKKSAEGIELLENGKKILFYQLSPKSVDGKYERAGYVHPLYDLNEKILTEDMPADHPYHRGIFWAWHQLIWNDKSVGDGWISENISYKPEKADVKEEKNNLVLASEMIWNAQVDSNLTPIVKEKTTITVFKSTPQYHIIDFNITLIALVDNLKIGGSDDAKGYGGFCLRLKLPKAISFVSGNKEVIPQETAVAAGPWMDISGSFEGDSAPKSGVTVFGYPPGNDNNNPWILRSVTSMQNVPYPGRTPVLLSKKGLTLKYRIIVHNSEIKIDDIEKLYQDYIKGK